MGLPFPTEMRRLPYFSSKTCSPQLREVLPDHAVNVDGSGEVGLTSARTALWERRDQLEAAVPAHEACDEVDLLGVENEALRLPLCRYRLSRG